MIFAMHPFHTPFRSVKKRLFFIFATMCLFLAVQGLQAQSCTASISGELVICPGGSRVLTASAAASYLWSNGTSSNTITVTAAGTYTVTTTNASGCTATASATTRILSAGTLSASVPLALNGYPVCFGSSIQLSSTVPGGTWSTFSSFPAVSVNPVSGLATGIRANYFTDTSSVRYQVSATGCTVGALITVESRGLNPGTISGGSTNLCYNSFGVQTTQLSTNSSFSGAWASSNPAITVNSSGLVSTNGPGTTTISYTVTAEGCANSATTQVTWNALPNTAVTIPASVCAGQSFNISVPNAGPGTTYNWFGPDITNVNSNSTTVTIPPSTPGGLQSYAVTITPANGCGAIGYGSVSVGGLPNVNITATPNPVCVGLTLDLSVPAAASTTYAWSGPGLNSTTGSSVTANPTVLGAQTYTVTATTTPYLGGCTNTGTSNVNVTFCCPTITFTAPGVTQPTCTTAGTIVVNASSTGPLEYSVDNGVNWQSGATFSGLVPGNYTLKARLAATPTCEATYGSNPVALNSPYTASTTTDTWTGCVSTNWATPGNWADGSVPTATDDVVIPNVTNDPVITGGTAAVAKSALVQAGALLTIQASGSLAINGATGFAFETFGNLDNFGTLRIGNLSSVANRGIVHRNGGTLNNKMGGLIQIDRTSAGEAFYMSGIVNNDGTISIGSLAAVEDIGVSLDAPGVLNNNNGGTLNIDRSDLVGIANFSSINNNGTMNIGLNANVGQDGIQNQGAIVNATTGVINISKFNSNGIWNYSGSLQNSGTITLTNTGGSGNGILSYVPFTNNAGAEINIDQMLSGIITTNTFTNAGLIRVGENGALGGYGINNVGGATAVFNNNAGGDIRIQQTGLDAVKNDANCTFNNNSCATLAIFDNLNNSGIFTNAGLFTVNTTQAHTNTGLTNNGIIGYASANQIPNVTNNEIIIGPTTANACDVISPAFGLGSPVNFSILGVFTNAAATISAGVFTLATNTFTPNAILPEGTRVYFVQIMDGGCTRIVPWQLTTQNCCAVPQALCKTATIALAGNSATLTVAAVNNGSTAPCGLQSITVAPNAFNCSHVGTPQTVTLTVTDVNNAISTCQTTVNVVDNTAPTLTCPTNATINANASCQSTIGTYSPVSLSDNCNPSPAVTQSPAASTLLTGHNSTQTVTLTANDGNGNTATCSLVVTLKDVTAPTITCPANATINANASCQGTIGTYSAVSLSDNCNPSPTVTQSPAASTLLTGHNSTQTVTLTANDGNGNTATCALTVTLKDVTAPTITCPANATVNANASCQGTIGAYSAVSLSDNCNPSPTVTQSPAASTLLTGHNSTQTVTLTANDGNGNTATCALTVTLKDVTAPTLTCPANATINANASCQGTIGAYSAVSLSDNCNPSPTVTQSPAASTLLTGHNSTQTVTLTANDGNGNTATCALTVTLKDVTAPTITCPANATINANASCQGTIGTYSAVSLSDNCNPSPTVTQSPAASTLLTGHNSTQTVTLTANDGNGNTATCALTVTLKDVTAPTITCPANATINANASCQGTIGVYSAVSLSDNCNPSPTVNQSPAASTLLIGHNSTQTVTLTANDGNGNTATCSLVVTLKDVTAPTITCPANATVNANASCQGTIGAYSAVSLSDNCNPSPTVTQSPAASTLLTGHNSTQTVTLTANDGNGNTATCALTVTLKDVTAPTLTCPANATINANASCQSAIGSYSAVSLSDNCNPSPTVTQSPAASTLLTGHNSTQTVVLTANDGNGNTATCSLVVTLKDVAAPTVIFKNALVSLNAAGTATLSTANVFQSGSDNCGTVNLVSAIPNAFNCSNLGATTVTLTVNDGNGNTATCTAIVTVQDLLAPVAKCKNATLNLGANGTVVVPPASVNNNSTDNCTVNFAVVPATLTCANIGNNIVTLRVTDGANNLSTCTAIVTLKDATAPTALCKNATIFLNDTGSATLSVAQVNNGSSDNCGTSSFSLSKTLFNCSELTGATWPVFLTVKDAANNSSTCTAYVTVKDNIAPTAICENTTVELGSNGKAVVYGADLAEGSYDNCAVWSYSPVAKIYTTANIGTNNLTITVRDWSNNAATCVSQVTVLPYSAGLGITVEDRDVTPFNTSEQEDILVHLYPNPAFDRVNLAFELEADQDYLVSIWDVTGRLRLEQSAPGKAGENQMLLDLRDLPAGMYVVVFESGGQQVQKKLVKDRDE
jgi:hypothetical protein